MSLSLHAFSEETLGTKFYVSIQMPDESRRNMPIMFADHSVIYLPTIDKYSYIIFNGAEIWHPRNGIQDNSILDTQYSDDLNKIKVIDEKIYTDLITLIENTARSAEDDIFSYQSGNNKEIFKMPNGIRS